MLAFTISLCSDPVRDTTELVKAGDQRPLAEQLPGEDGAPLVAEEAPKSDRRLEEMICCLC